VFAGVGLANLAHRHPRILAFRLHSLEVWRLPLLVMILQSMAWFVAWTLRRQTGSGRWLVVGLAMGLIRPPGPT
jgi:hypothetical protein